MDSTNPNAQQQQQPPPIPQLATPPQQQHHPHHQHQQHQQHQQIKLQHHHQHQQNQPHQQHMPRHQHPPQYVSYQGSYYHHNQPSFPQSLYYPQYQPPFAQQTWAPTSANYTTLPIINSMVNPPPQSNVPQHNKTSSHIVNQVITTEKTHHHGTPERQSSLTARERRPATMTDPKTKEQVDIAVLASKPTNACKQKGESSSPAANNSSSQQQQDQQKQQEVKKKHTNNNQAVQEFLSRVSDVSTVTPVASKAVDNGPQHVQTSSPQEGDDKEKLAGTDESSLPQSQSTPSEQPGHEATESRQPQSQPQPQPAVHTKNSQLQKVCEEVPEISFEADDKENIPSLVKEDAKEVVVEIDQENKRLSPPSSVIQTSDSSGQESAEKINGNEDNNGGDEDSNREVQTESESKDLLHYEPGQYHPISNQSGRRIYSKKFLIDVAGKVCKIDVSSLYPSRVGDSVNDSALPGGFNGNFDPFTPVYCNQRNAAANRQTDPSRRLNQHNYSGRSSTGQERQRKIINPSASLSQEVELKTVSNPWRPAKEIMNEDAPSNVAELDALKKKFRSILNKLTPNNFDNLAESVTELGIDSEAKLGEVIDIVFAKALSEPGYCVLYGRMCDHLKKVTTGQYFGNTLLRRCQYQFTSDIYSGINMVERKQKIENETDPEVKKQLEEELYEEMFKCRMKGLGLIKFIGELYKIDMLNDSIMLECVVRLLSDVSEESLECLCDLLTTIGQKLDESLSKSKSAPDKKQPKSASRPNTSSGGKTLASVVATGPPKAPEPVTGYTSLDQVFDQLHKIRKNKEIPISVRIRFKLLDTCELREKDNWQSKKTKDNNPKKIEEIREAHMEKLEQEKRQNAMGGRRSQEGRRGLGQASGSSSQISSLVNESNANRGISGMHTSSSSHLIRDHSSSDNMKSSHHLVEEHQRSKDQMKLAFLSKNSKETEHGSLRPQYGFKVLPMGNSGSTAANSLAPKVAGIPAGAQSATSRASLKPDANHEI